MSARMTLRAASITAAVLLLAPVLRAQPARTTLPSIAERTAGMRKLDGFFPLYWDSTTGRLHMEIARFNQEVLNIMGLASGLGSNDIGLDRGQLQESRIVFFERVGPRVLMVQPNYSFRSSSTDAAEVRSVRDAFARSVLWGFTATAESGASVLVDLTDYLLRDATNMAPSLTPGSYRLDNTRSVVSMPLTMNFPQNTEMEVELTFISQPGPGAAGRGGGASFEGVGSVAATSEAASMRVHHSFIELPDANYKPRRFDPRSGYGAFSYDDYSAPLGQPLTQRFIRRHRLEKRDPRAATSEAVKPIIYYLDPGTPEPIRSALLEGARWWNQAFEAAGYRNAFQVQLLPAGVSPLDIRYNVINWVHRSTRGWSYGSSVSDPRTGEIIKGVVTLGSLRVRQDWMIAEGLLQPYRNGNETTPEIQTWALQRMKQLSAHEVGHTLGLGHNYYSSSAESGRISVMDYPHPLVTLRADGSLDHAQVYTNAIGAWDKVAITYGYQHFPNGTDENVALVQILDRAWAQDVRYLTNQDLGAHPRVDQWSNGTNAATELTRMLNVRRAALTRFGDNAIKRGTPMAQLEETLVPLYMHHRFQVDAALNSIGGSDYIYAMRGDGRDPARAVSGADQRAALSALLRVLRPAELTLPATLLSRIPPRPPGFGRTRELFPRNTGAVFDALTPALVAADQVISGILSPDRAARLVEQRLRDPSLPGLGEVMDSLFAVAFRSTAGSAYEAAVQRVVQRVLVDELIEIAGSAPLAEVRALASARLRAHGQMLGGSVIAGMQPDAEMAMAHSALLADDIRRFLERPVTSVAPRTTIPAAPPGAPIGEPAMDWLWRYDPLCGVPRWGMDGAGSVWRE